MNNSSVFAMVTIAAISAGISVWVTNMLLGNPDEATYSVLTVEPINSELAEPNEYTFNVNAINPTVDVYVGSCVDTDGDGVINSAEQRACNEIKENKE